MAGFGLMPLRAPYDEEDELTRQADFVPPAPVDGEVRQPLPAGPQLEDVPAFNPKPLFAPEKSFRDDVGERRRRDFEEAQSDDRWGGVAGNAIQNFYNASVGRPVDTRGGASAAKALTDRRAMEDAEAKRAAAAEENDPQSDSSKQVRAWLQQTLPEIAKEMGPGFERMSYAQATRAFPFIKEHVAQIRSANQLKANEEKAKQERINKLADEESKRKWQEGRDAANNSSRERAAALSAGGKAGQQAFANASDLRKELNTNPVTKAAQESATSWDKMQAATKDPSPAGDLAIIFSFMKVMDPGSTVREGEQASAQNAAGVDQQIRNLYNQALKGTRLSPEQRVDFLRRGREFNEAHQRRYRALADQYGALAERNGFARGDVVLDVGLGGTANQNPNVQIVNGKKYFMRPDGNWEVEE